VRAKIQSSSESAGFVVQGQLALANASDTSVPRTPAAAQWGRVTEGDAQRWAETFATASFGDPLFGAVMALLLQPSRSERVQVQRSA
jgi:hypothetical protein